MLLIGLTSLLMAIPLYSSTITPTLLTRITSIILLFSAVLSFNCLYVQAIGSGLGLYSGLFHVTSVTQAMECFLFVVGAFILLPWTSALKSNIVERFESITKYDGLQSGSVVVTTATQPDNSQLFTPSGEVTDKDFLSDERTQFNNSLNEQNYLTTMDPFYKVRNLLRSSDPAKYTTAVPTIPEYPLIILFTTIGASFLISSSDLVSMYLSIELQSFAVYILAAIYRNSESATSAGLKYFLLGALSSALILLGSSIVYAYTGLTSFEGIYMIANVKDVLLNSSGINGGSLVAEQISNVDQLSQGIVLGVLIIGVGLLFKVAAAPFHNWAPDVYDGVPTIVTTWLTVMPKISLFVFLLELNDLGSLLDIAGGPLMNVWKNLLLTTSLLSLVIGTVVGLAQYRLKRLLAFSTISHVGFLLLALSVNSEDSVASFLFYLIQYSLTNLNAFFVVLAFGYIIHSSGRTGYNVASDPKSMYQTSDYLQHKNSDISFISQLKGQFHANPVLGLSLAICLFSMAGIPPLVGFFAKYMVLYSAIENGYYFLALTGILASVISAAYYLRIIKVIHFDVPEVSWLPRNQVITSTHSYVIAVLTLFITLFILSPSLLLNSSNLLALSLFTA